MYAKEKCISCFEADSRKAGPFPCEYPGCNEPTHIIRLTLRELEGLKGLREDEKFSHIFKNNLGRAVCPNHV